jgi:ribosomal protein L17
MNEYESELNKYVESNPPEVKAVNPLEKAVQAVDQEKEVGFKLSEKQSVDSNPDEYAKYHQVAKKRKLPVEMVKRNWDSFKADETKVDYKKLRDNSPFTTELLSNPDNMKLFKDDVGFLQELESQSVRSRKPEGFVTETAQAIGGAARQGTNSLGSGMLALGGAFGKFDLADMAEDIAENERLANDINLNKPSFVKEFDALLQEEGNDVDQAWSQFTTGISQIRNKGLMEGISNLGAGGAKTIFESLDYLGEYVVNPRGTSVMIAQNLPNALPSIAAFAAGTAAAGPIGGAIGAFGAGSVTETGAGILQELRDNGVDLTDPKQILKAFNNKELMAKTKERAAIKGLTTGAIDAIFTKYAGAFFRGAGSKTLGTAIGKQVAGKVAGKTAGKLVAKDIGKQVGAFGLDVAVQGVGEFLSETGGQLAREKGDLSKVSISEGLAEAATSTGKGIAETIIGSARVKVDKNSLNHLKTTVQSGIAAIKNGETFDALGVLVQRVKESKTMQRAPEIIKEHINKVSEDGKVYFQSDDWDSLFPDNPVEKADELLPGGRAQYLESKESGNPMEVSKGDYVTDLAQKNEELNTIVRQEVDGLTESENDEILNNLNEDMEGAVEAVQEQLLREETERASFEAVQDNVKSQLKDVGFDEGTADAYAAAMEPIKVMAERSGIDPQKLFDRYNIKIRRGESAETVQESTKAKVEPIDIESLEGDGKIIADELIAQEIETMISEIQQSEAGKRSGVLDDKGVNVNTSTKSTFPGYYSSIKAKNKADFEKAAKSKKGAKYSRIRQEAINRLRDGYENIHSGPNMPSNEFRALLNEPLINEDGTTQEDFNLFQDETKEYFQEGLRLKDKLEAEGFEFIYEEPEKGPGIRTDMLSHSVKVLDAKGKKVGSFTFHENMEQERVSKFSGVKTKLNPLETWSAQVDKNQRRKGIASAAYSMIEDILGKTLSPSGSQTKAAKALWNSQNRAFGKDKTLFQQEEGESPRGRIRISPKREITIDLFKNADKSTFLHEAGHLFLEVFSDLATDINADSGIVEDYNSILKELGIESREEIKTEHHEKWAKMFETYLATGKAPSSKLQSAFRKFRVFMASLYGKLLKNKVKLSPEIRGVMDRMFASQEEIQEMMQERFISDDNISQYVDALGLNEKDTERLLKAHQEARHGAEETLISKEVKRLAKLETKQFKEIEENVIKEVQAQADAMPLYNAENIIKQEGKFNTKELKSLIGPEKYELVKERKITSPKGAPVEILADFAGYNSAEQFIDELLANPTKEDFIKTSVQARMIQEVNTNFSDGSIKQDAQDIVSEKTKELRALELELLLKNSKPEAKTALERIARKLPKNKDIAKVASAKILQTNLKDLKPHIFSRMENKSRKASMEAMLKGDFETAYQEKYKERLNNELYNQARKLELGIEKFEAKVKKLFAKKEEKLAKSHELNYINLARGILNDFGIILMGERREQKVSGYMKTLAQVDPTGFERVSAVGDLLADIPVREKKHLTLSEYENIRETVEAIIEVAKDEKSIDTVKGRMAKEDILKDFLERSDNVKKHKVVSGRSLMDIIKLAFLDVNAGYTRVEHFINQLDNFDINGPLRIGVFDPIKDAQVKYDSTVTEELKKLNTIIENRFKKVFQDKRKINLSDYYANQENETVTQKEIVVMILNSGNRSNLEKLLVGRGWGDLDSEGNLNLSKYNAFLQDMVAKDLITKDMLDGVQEIWDLIETRKPEIQKSYKAVTGRFMGEITADEFTIPGLDITLKGGYYPAKTDSLKVADQARRDNQTAFDMNNAAFTYAAVPKGMTNSRIENYRKALSLDINLIKSHLEETIRFTTLAEPVHNANKILKSGAFKDRIQSIVPNGASIIFDSWLARVSFQRTMTPASSRSDAIFSKAALQLNQGATIQIMAGNTLNAIEQVTEIVKYIPDLGDTQVQGAKNLMGSYKKAVSDPTGFVKNVMELSPFMKERLQNTERKVAEQYYDLTVARTDLGRKYKKVANFTKNHAFFLQRMASFATDPMVWNAAFNKGLNDGLSDADAVRFADSLISRVGGDKSPLTASTKESGGVLSKLLMSFTGFFINSMNQVQFAKDKPTTYLYTVFLTSVMGAVLRKAFRGKFDEDEDGYADDAFDVLALSQLRFLTASRPLASHTLRFIEGLQSDAYYDDRVRLSPLLSTVEGAKGAVNLVKKDDPTKRDVGQAAAVLGTLTGIPLARPVKAAVELLDDE